MDVAREGDLLILALNLFESRLLLHALRQIRANYQIKPDQLEDNVAAAWYSTRGCEAARMSPEEIREWRESLHGYRQANRELLQRWERDLDQQRHRRHELRIRLGEAPQFLTVLNDHRLFLAARHDIGQAEMDLQSLGRISKLEPARQAALYEIHLLAYVMEEVLRHITPA